MLPHFFSFFGGFGFKYNLLSILFVKVRSDSEPNL
jgi:hypothetical protein